MNLLPLLLNGCSRTPAPAPRVDREPPTADTAAETCVEKTWYRDADGDEFGADTGTVSACSPGPDGYAAVGGDCDDANSHVYPDHLENCATDADDDCSGDPALGRDEEPRDCTRYFRDSDGDGYGRPLADECICGPAEHYAATAGDCDDADPANWPGQPNCLRVGIDVDGDVRLNGYQVEQHVGLAIAGDVTGDGEEELVVASSIYAGEEGEEGALYLVPRGLDGAVSLGDPAVERIVGSAEAETTGLGGCVLVPPADFLGDGRPLFAVGTDSGNWLVRAEVTGGELSAARYGVLRPEGEAGGCNLVNGGDVDGDGVVDLLIGADGSDEGGSSAGAVYIASVPPKGDWSYADVATASLIGESAGDWAGKCVASAGDTDGDGVGDVLVGAIFAGGGTAYLVRGPVAGSMSLADADATFFASTGDASAGCGLAGGGDGDGDGLPDLLIGAYTWSRERGAAWLVPGTVSGSGTLEDAAVASFLGDETSWTGGNLAWLHLAGERDAAVIGAELSSLNEIYAGAVVVAPSPVVGTHYTGAYGRTYVGVEQNEGLGTSLENAGDWDGDGADDLLVSAWGASPSGVLQAGSIHLLPGASFAR